MGAVAPIAPRRPVRASGRARRQARRACRDQRVSRGHDRGRRPRSGRRSGLISSSTTSKGNRHALRSAHARLDHACLRRRRFRPDPLGHRRTEGQIRERALDVRSPRTFRGRSFTRASIVGSRTRSGILPVTIRDGFYGRFFLTAEDKLEFLEQCVTWPCHGDPTYTYSDVERAVVARLRKARSSRSSVRKSRSSAGDGSSRFFRSSRPATSRSPRRRLPLRSRTCSADPPRGPPRSRRLSRTGIRNQKREGPTSTAARPPQRVGSAGRFAGPDRIPALCAAFAPVPRPRFPGSRFRREPPNRKEQEQRQWKRQSNCASSIPRP